MQVLFSAVKLFATVMFHGNQDRSDNLVPTHTLHAVQALQNGIMDVLMRAFSNSNLFHSISKCKLYRLKLYIHKRQVEG